MLKRVLVTGKNGQLGQSLQKISHKYVDFKFEFVGREQLDLSSDKSITAFFSNNELRFDAIINTAAYTAVDKAETEQALANQINYLAVKQLANIAKAQGTMLLHISTDYVYSGTNHRPYLESDTPNPVNHYGSTKLLGEQAIQASGCIGAVVRTSWVYSEFGTNFVKTMLDLSKNLDELNVIFDQIGTPTYATDLANALLHILTSSYIKPENNGENRSSLSGLTRQSNTSIYHYSNEGICSWYDFSQAIFKLSNIPCKVTPIETSDYPTPAKRPYFSVLNKAKIKQEFALSIPYWRDSLADCLAELARVS